MWMSVFLLFIYTLAIQGKVFYDEDWQEKRFKINVKTDLNSQRRRNEYQFDRKIDCPNVLNVDIELNLEKIELELYLNTLVEPELIPIFIGENNELQLWSEYQKLPERRRETCYYQSRLDDSFITVEDEFGYFTGKMTGSFSTKSGSYEFEQLKDSKKQTKGANEKYRIRKVIFEGAYDVDVAYGNTEENYVGDIASPAAGWKSTGSREKRATKVPMYIEIMAVVDYSLYNRYFVLTSADKSAEDRKTEAMSDIRYELSQIFNGMDARYKSINIPEYSYSTYLKGISVATDKASSQYTESLRTAASPRDSVDITLTLTKFYNWTRESPQVEKFAGYDHIMMFSEYDFVSGGNRGVQGLSFIGQICREQRVSIIEYEGIKVVTQVSTHELGHNLGAKHDGEAGCIETDNYIMEAVLTFTPGATANLCCFSTCSTLAFKNTTAMLDNQNINCMVNDSAVFNATEYASYLSMPPGLRYSRDEQCQAITGESGSYSRGVISEICTKFQCYRPSSSQLIDEEGRALDKTTCGNRMWCENYVCVNNDSAPLVSLDEQCQMVLGNSSATYGGGQSQIGSVCTNLICYKPGDSKVSGLATGALDSTPCGNKKWCQSGSCVDNANAPATSDCGFGDISIMSGKTCAELITEDSSRCTQVPWMSNCCKTCGTSSTTTVAVTPSSTVAGGGGQNTATGGTVAQSTPAAVQTTSAAVQPSSTVTIVQSSAASVVTTQEAPAVTTQAAPAVTTQASGPATAHPIKTKITFSASKCGDQTWKTNCIAALKAVHSNKPTTMESCTTGSSIVVYVVENGSPVTDEVRALTASQLRNAINNNELTIGSTAYSVQGQPVVINGNTEATICSYQSSEAQCVSGSCSLDSSNKLVCTADNNNATWILVGGIVGGVALAILIAILLYCFLRFKDNIIQPVNMKKRRYSRKSGRIRTRPTPLPEPQPIQAPAKYGYHGYPGTQPSWTKPPPTRASHGQYSSMFPTERIIVSQWTSKTPF